MDGAWEACADADAILTPFIMVWVLHVAEKRGVPCYLWDTHPFTPTRSFPSFTFTGLFPWWYQVSDRLPYWFRAGGGFNALTHRMIQRVLLNIGLRLTNKWRQRRLQLPPLKNVAPLLKFYNETAVVLYCYSAVAVPVPPDWPARHHVTGYWLLDSGDEWQPPQDLLDFLAAGPAPVCIGFSSARDRNPERLTKIVLGALASAGCRGIVLTGRGGMVKTQTTSDVYIAEAIPHDWLFPRVAAVVHHGGAGSCAAVLRAGVPSVVVPWWGDMHFWADCLLKLGVSPSPLPKSRLSEDRLAHAIRMTLDDPKIRIRAKEVAVAIAAEDGVTRAVEIVTGKS
jgi:sterol 3beta-glucosyltransferase